MLHGSVCLRLHAAWECESACGMGVYVCMRNGSVCLHAEWECVSMSVCYMGFCAGMGVYVCMLHGSWCLHSAQECVYVCMLHGCLCLHGSVCLHATWGGVCMLHGSIVCVYVCILHGFLCLHGSVCLHATWVSVSAWTCLSACCLIVCPHAERECVFAWECVSSSKEKNRRRICDHSIPLKKMCIPREERSRATHISWRRFVGWNTHHIKTKQKQTNKNKKVNKRDRFQLLQLVECSLRPQKP